MLNGIVAGPVFEAAERVLSRHAEYRRFRDGQLSGAEWAAFVDRCAPDLEQSGLPPADAHFAKRYPPCESAFVRAALERLGRRGILPLGAAYDEAGCDALARSLRRSYDHNGHHTYIYPEEARLLCAVAEIARPRRALFLGSYYGYWAAWAIPAIARAGGQVILVDPNPAVCGTARRNLAAPGGPLAPHAAAVEIVADFGETFLDACPATYDLVVLDAETPRTDPDPERRGKAIYHLLLRHCLPRLAPGALLVCHNILLRDHTGAAFFEPVIRRNRCELGPFLELAAREFAIFEEIASTEGVGIGLYRGGEARR